MSKSYSGHHVMKIAFRNGWTKGTWGRGSRNNTRPPWTHPNFGTLEKGGSGKYSRKPWVHRDTTGEKVTEYPRMIDALFALHPNDPEAQ